MVYIYSFPLQQTLMYYFHLNTLNLVFWSVILSIIFGYFSWHIVEKRVLKYKTIFNASDILIKKVKC
jgi:peptidoglycan/LPS O-acetylase OafA/YrhL